MPEVSILLRQVIAFALFALGLGYFSNSPSYTYHDPAMALIRVSFSLASERKGACRHFTPEEIAAMAPNMRRPLDCPRERVPIYVEISMDGKPVLGKSYEPTGLAKDGSTSIYESIPAPAGSHRIKARLRDSSRATGFDYENSVSVNLKPKELFVIDFHKDRGGFFFK